MQRDTSFLHFFRAIAALWVVLAHCAIWGWGGVPDLLEPKKAVDLFMVISGFLMMFTIDKGVTREDPNQVATWRNFFIRRLFRIAPAFYLAFVIAAFAQGWVVPAARHLMSLHPDQWNGFAAELPDHSPVSLFLHATFLFGLLPDYSAVSGLPAWSLSVEMQFYFLFPLIYLAVRRWSFGAVAMALGVASLLLTRQYYHGVESGRLPTFAEPSLLIFHLAKFVVGMLIYEAGRTKKPMLILLAALLLAAAAVRPYGLPASGLMLIVAGLAWCWYLGVPDRINALFKSAFVGFLSDASYSVYLLHNLIINLVGWPVLAWVRGLGAPLWVAEAALTVSVVATAYPLAYLMYRTVEVAGVRWGKRMAHSGAPIAAPMT
jgi:peptidoglycan/LPS O-acetylase OafA/YrhL